MELLRPVSGTASVTRSDGSTANLKVGDPVYQGDTVQTADGSSMGITFKDGTVFNMTASARMVLNNMVYEEGGSENAMLFSLVQGGFSFVAGKVAPTGDMKIDTPVATMGIRGTTPVVLIADDGKTTFSLLKDPGTDKSGVYQLFHRESGELIGTVSDTGVKFDLVTVNSAPVEIVKTATDLLADSQVQQSLSIVFSKAQQNPFNEGAATGTGNDEQNDGQEGGQEGQGGDGGETGEGSDGQQGEAVPGSGVSTETVEASLEGDAAEPLGAGSGTDLNAEAGADPGGVADDGPADTGGGDPVVETQAPVETSRTNRPRRSQSGSYCTIDNFARLANGY